MDDPCYLKYLYWELGGISKDAAAKLTGKTPRQWRRYESGDVPIPVAVLRTLETHAAGLMNHAGAGWFGWRTVRGNLCTPDGFEVSPGEIRSLPLLYARIADLQRQLRKSESVRKDFSNVVPFPDTGNELIKGK